METEEAGWLSQGNLHRIPCRFEFKTEGLPGEPLNSQLHAG